MPQVLLLNNDNQPLQYTSWKRAVVLLLKGKAEVEEKIKRIEDYIKEAHRLISELNVYLE